MATTDISATTHTPALSAAEVPQPAVPAGIATLFGSGDHKVIGRLYIGFSLVLGVGSLALAAVSALAQRSGAATASFPKIEWVSQVSTLSRVGLAFFFLVPLFIGLAVYVVPLQVGAATIAFPRAVAASFWTWLVASAMAILAWMLNGGPGGGDAQMVDLSYFSLGLAVVALLIASIAVATTVITFRAPGMTLDRVPFFSWSMVVATGVWALTLPVLLGELVLIYLDNHYGLGESFAIASQQHQWTVISWAFSAPQVFAYAIPAAGIAADAVTTLGKARHPQRSMMLTAIGAVGVFSVGAWVQPAFYPGVFTNWAFMTWSVALVLPGLLVLGGLASALRKGKPSAASPLLGALLVPLLLLLGGAGAALFGIHPLGLSDLASAYPAAVQDATSNVWYQPAAQVGVYGIVILAGAVGALAGLAYWGAKISGHKLSDGPGKLAVPLVFVGALLYGVPLVVVGFSQKAESLGSAGTLDTLSFVSVAGAGAALAGLLLMGIGLLGSLAAGAADADPWGSGQTLEWATDSPPARGNFGELAEVSSGEPLLDLATEASA